MTYNTVMLIALKEMKLDIHNYNLNIRDNILDIITEYLS